MSLYRLGYWNLPTKIRKKEHTKWKKSLFYFVLSMICRIFAPSIKK